MNLRWRMTSLIVLVIGVVVAAYAGAVYLRLDRVLHAELDARLHQDFELASQALQYQRGNWEWRDFQRAYNKPELLAQRIEVWTLGGELRYTRHVTPVLAQLKLPPPQAVEIPYQTLRHTIDDEPANLRLLTGIFFAGDDDERSGWYLRVVRTDQHVHGELDGLLRQLLLLYPIALCLAGLGGWWLAGRMVQPITVLGNAALAIQPAALDQRLPVKGTQEVRRLALAFNDTLDRLQQAFEQLSQFSSDVAHELRTPLTALRNQGELALRNSAATMDPQTRNVLVSMLEEASRLGRMIDRLLLIARADQTRMKPALLCQPLAPIAEDIIGLMQILAEERQLSLRLEGDRQVLAVVDDDCLRQVLIDLLDNALRYAQSQVVVRLVAEPDCSRIDIEDDGPGIPVDQRQRMLQRFARGDESRTRRPLSAGGFGLGLAIVSSLTQLQKGTLELADVVDERGRMRNGLTVRLRFPALHAERDDASRPRKPKCQILPV